MKSFLILINIFFTWISFSQENYVVMLSLDGFRYDYIEKHNAKNLKKIAKKGVWVKRMKPSNPTKTFPNHYSIVTGLYPDNHGLIGNEFYDSKMNKKYSLSDRKAVRNGKFYGGEPIWNTAKKEGLLSASYFWVGSEADVNESNPNIWKKYDSKITFEQRIDSVISWLKLPQKKRPRLITLYYHQPDKAGHLFGPNSKEVAKQVKYVDEQVDRLYQKLITLPFGNHINLIVVSDHGMRSISKEKQIILSNYINKEDVFGIYGSNPVYTLKAKKGKEKKLYNQLKKVKHIYVYKKGEARKKLHLSNHHRTNDMIIIGKKGYSVFPTRAFGRRFGGTHGYLNCDKQMSSIFIGVGNAFKNGYTQKSINNVDVYNLVAHILGITPAKNDGNFNHVKKLLK